MKKDIDLNLYSVLNLPPCIIYDEDVLRKAYLIESKNWHPDYFSNASADLIEQAEQRISLINKAFKVFSHLPDSCSYFLLCNGYNIHDDKLHSNFLMEMMDLNDEIENSLQPLSEQIISKIQHLTSDYIYKLKQLANQVQDNNTEENRKLLNQCLMEWKYIQRITDAAGVKTSL